MERETVTVVGDALLDVRIVPAAPTSPGGDVPAQIAIGPGGQGANVAVRLARRGVPVALRCALGADAAGDLVRAGLAGEGVSLEALGVAATGAVAIVVDPGGGRTMFSRRVPFADRAAVSHPGWLVVSGYLLAEPDAPALAEQLAARRGRLAILGCDVAPDRRSAWVEAAAATRADLVVLNAAEASWAGSLGEVRAVTEDRGAAVTFAGSTLRASAPPAVAVDTTGAGDAFAAALVAELRHAWPPDEDAIRRALDEALALAAAVTAVHGAQARVALEGERRGTLAG